MFGLKYLCFGLKYLYGRFLTKSKVYEPVVDGFKSTYMIVLFSIDKLNKLCLFYLSLILIFSNYLIEPTHD